MFTAILVGAALFCAVIHAQCATAQYSSISPVGAQSMPPGTPESWIERTEKHELGIIQDDTHPIRYLVRKQDRHGDTTREVLESQQGNVARLIQRDGKPITAAEDEAERDRLNAILSSPDDLLKHEQHDNETRTYVVQLVKLMPSAMIYTYTPGQPQPAGATSPQVVIDFRPDPNFHPPTMISQVLTGLAGRLWIDSRTSTMTRVQGHVLRPVNFGWGVVAHIYPGGHIELEQTCVDGTRWAYSHVDEDLSVREVMLHTVNEKTKMRAWNFQLLPAPLSVQDAVHTLLAEHIPLR